MSRRYRASYSQRAMFHDYHLSGANPVYHIALPTVVETDIDIQVLQDSLQSIVDRHSALRTNLVANGGDVDQIVHDHVPLDFEVLSLERPDAEHLDAALETATNEPFDLGVDPPLRVRLFVGPPRPVLHFVVHHAASDFESLIVILEELGERYRSGSAANSPVGAGYHEFADWETAYVDSENGRRALAYWTERLAELPAIGDLPLDSPRGARRTYAGAEVEVDLPASVVAQLTGHSQEHGVSRNAVLLAAAHALMGRLTASRHAVVGLTGSQRQARQFRRTMGNFTNPMVTHSDLGGAATFGELVRQLNRQVMRALPHSALPFPLVVEQVRPSHDSSRTPFFSVLYTYNRSRQRGQDDFSGFVGGYGRLDLGEIVLRQLPLRRAGSMFDLCLIAFDSTNEIRLVWQYNDDYLQATTVRRFADCFAALLEAGLADPEASLDSVGAVLPGAELDALSANAAGERREWAGPATLADALERQAATTPDRTAVVCAETSLTYAELHHQADRLAARLLAEGVGPEDRVAILLRRTAWLPVGLLGALKAGAAYVPLDADWPTATLRAAVAASGARVVLTAHDGPAVDGLTGVRLVQVGTDGASDQVGIRTQRYAAAAASVVCMPGPTGLSPAVVRTNWAMLNGLLALQERHGMGARDAFLHKAPVASEATAMEILWPLLVGARVVVAEPVDGPEYRWIPELVRRHAVTALHLDSSLLKAGLEHLADEPMPTLRLVVSSGRTMTAAQVRTAGTRLGCEVEHLYSCAETTGAATWWSAGSAPAGAPAMSSPLPNVRCYILDSLMRPAPRGVVGELYVAGSQLARGYLDRPALTADRFRPDPFRPGQRAYRTGELARWMSNGTIECLGRADDQVSVAGYPVRLEEVRRAVEADEDVASAIVVAHDDGTQRRVLAHVVPIDHATFVPRRLWIRLRSAYPGYQVPSGVVTVSQWPVGQAGTVAADQLPAPGAGDWLDRAVNQVEPRSPLEQEIATLWSELLGVDEVGAHADFFMIGGHSVTAARLIVRMKQRFGVDLSVADVFGAPTLAEFTEVVLDRALADVGSVDPEGATE